jgi:hypothetical protein
MIACALIIAALTALYAASGGSGGAAKNVRAGGAFVEIFADDSKLQKTLHKAKKDLEGFGNAISKIGFASLGGDVAQITLLGKALAEAVQHASGIGDLAKSLGSTTEEASRLQFAFESVGVSAEEFTRMAEGMQQKILAAARDGNEGFAQLGLSARQLMRLPLQKQLEAIGQAFGRFNDDAAKSELAAQIFGNNWQRALRLVEGGPEKLAEALGEADRAGVALSKEQVAQAREIESAWHTTVATLRQGFLEIGRALFGEADEVKRLAGEVRSFLNGITKYIRENKEMIVEVATGTATFIALDLALIGLGATITALGVLLGVASAALSGLGALLGFLLSPIGAFLAGFVAVGALVISQSDDAATAAGVMANTFEDHFSRIKAGFEEMAADAMESFNAITTYMRKGDMGAAFATTLAFLRLEWAKLTAYWTRQWVDFKGTFVDGWHDVGFAVSYIWESIGYSIKYTMLNVLNVVVKMFEYTIGQLVNKAAWLLEQVDMDETAAKLRAFTKSGGEAVAEMQRGLDKGYEEAVTDIGERRAKQQAESDKYRAAQNAGRDAEVEAAREELRKLTEGAKEDVKSIKPKSGEDAGASARRPGLGDIDFLPRATKGLFQGANNNFAAALGIGDDINRSMLRANEDTARNTADIREILAAGGGIKSEEAPRARTGDTVYR